MSLALKEITREGVLRAVVECDSLGREAFLDKYGFGRSRAYFLVHDGKRYDSKAIAGVAYAYSKDGASPLRSEEFTGGERTVRATLQALGFEVVADGEAQGPRWMDQLRLGGLYTRDQIADIISYPTAKRGGGDFDTHHLGPHRASGHGGGDREIVINGCAARLLDYLQPQESARLTNVGDPKEYGLKRVLLLDGDRTPNVEQVPHATSRGIERQRVVNES